MKRTFGYIFKTVALLLSLGSGLAQAQTIFAPVTVRGFTDDVVANKPGPANQSADNDMDGGNAPVRYCFVTQNYRNPSNQTPTTYLPANGIVNSAATRNLTFRLANYDSVNTLRIKGIGTGKLKFVTPRTARIIYLLGGAGNSQHGNTLFNATVKFTDSTTQVFSNMYFTDWFGMLDVVALQGVSRVNFDTNVIENSGTDPSLYQKQMVLLPANYGKQISYIKIEKPGTLATLNVLAVSVGFGCPTAPAAGKANADLTTICGPTNVNLSLTGAATDPELTYQWQASTNGTTWTNIQGANQKTYVVTPTQTTQYRVRLTCGAQNGSSVPVTVTLTVPAPTITYRDSVYCQLGQSDVPKVNPAGGTFSGTSGLLLDTKTGQVDLGASRPGQHTITYTNPGTCPVPVTATIKIEASPEPEFPNVITPNGDNLNDLFMVKLPPVSEFKMRIFSRWGKLVWENDDANQGWPGGKEGVYYYHVQITDCAGRQQALKGWVEVIR